MTAKELARTVMEQAKSCDFSIVTAESCTAGKLAKLLSEVPGAGKHLQGGIVAYTKEMKHKALGVPYELLLEKTAVCADVVERMARGALGISPADVAVAITGVAGPDPDEDGNPVGRVFCAALKRGGRSLVTQEQFKDLDREAVIEASIAKALQILAGVMGDTTHSAADRSRKASPRS